MDYKEKIQEYIDKEISALGKLDVEAINEVIHVLLNARERNAHIYVFGNGGSAATASHFVCDYNKGASDALGGEKFRFICLSDNTPVMTAIANDISYNEIFRKQLEGVLTKKDLVLAISGSGNSENVVQAVEYASGIGCEVIALTGYDGGRIKQLADYNLYVDIDDMQITEDIHMVFDHLMLKVMEHAGCWEHI